MADDYRYNKYLASNLVIVCYKTLSAEVAFLIESVQINRRFNNCYTYLRESTNESASCNAPAVLEVDKKWQLYSWFANLGGKPAKVK